MVSKMYFPRSLKMRGSPETTNSVYVWMNFRATA
jgi:hypothetical protein